MTTKPLLPDEEKRSQLAKVIGTSNKKTAPRGGLSAALIGDTNQATFPPPIMTQPPHGSNLCGTGRFCGVKKAYCMRESRQALPARHTMARTRWLFIGLSSISVFARRTLGPWPGIKSRRSRGWRRAGAVRRDRIPNRDRPASPGSRHRCPRRAAGSGVTGRVSAIPPAG
jgi:hypothetical protein